MAMAATVGPECQQCDAAMLLMEEHGHDPSEETWACKMCLARLRILRFSSSILETRSEHP